jgi:LCP family protein required for cell wall assembly
LIGRPRRRHVIDRSGRLHKVATRPQPVSHTPSKGGSKRVVRFLVLTILSLIGLFLLWAIISSFVAYSKVSDSNGTKRAPAFSFLGEVKPNQLQGEGDGRINVLLIGIGGAKHPGGQLADTLMVASFDPKNKEVGLLSIPRDLYVPIEGYGYNKINTAHSTGVQNPKETGGGPSLTKKTVSKILDLPIHYYIRVDFSGFEEIIDSLGGVTVDVENAIVDLSYPADNMIDYAPFRLSAGSQSLNGKTALKYARSRHAAGSEGSDFARAKRQQRLIEAVKQKALSAGVLANPKKINDIIGILGDHVKTDISLSEVERFVELWKNVDSTKIFSKVLDDSADGPLVSHSGDERGFILLPRTGDFSEVQEIAHSIFTDPYLRQEKATISFINATGSTTTGKQVVKLLTSYGYTVTDKTPKDQKKESITSLIDNKGDKPFTVKFLESRFKVTAKLKKDKNATDDLVLTLGTDYKPPTAATELSSTTKKASPSSSPSLSPSPKVSPTDASSISN